MQSDRKDILDNSGSKPENQDNKQVGTKTVSTPVAIETPVAPKDDAVAKAVDITADAAATVRRLSDTAEKEKQAAVAQAATAQKELEEKTRKELEALEQAKQDAETKLKEELDRQKEELVKAVTPQPTAIEATSVATPAPVAAPAPSATPTVTDEKSKVTIPPATDAKPFKPDVVPYESENESENEEEEDDIIDLHSAKEDSDVEDDTEPSVLTNLKKEIVPDSTTGTVTPAATSTSTQPSPTQPVDQNKEKDKEKKSFFEESAEKRDENAIAADEDPDLDLVKKHLGAISTAHTAVETTMVVGAVLGKHQSQTNPNTPTISKTHSGNLEVAASITHPITWVADVALTTIKNNKNVLDVANTTYNISKDVTTAALSKSTSIPVATFMPLYGPVIGLGISLAKTIYYFGRMVATKDHERAEAFYKQLKSSIMATVFQGVVGAAGVGITIAGSAALLSVVGLSIASGGTLAIVLGVGIGLVTVAPLVIKGVTTIAKWINKKWFAKKNPNVDVKTVSYEIIGEKSDAEKNYQETLTTRLEHTQRTVKLKELNNEGVSDPKQYLDRARVHDPYEHITTPTRSFTELLKDINSTRIRYKTLANKHSVQKDWAFGPVKLYHQAMQAKYEKRAFALWTLEHLLIQFRQIEVAEKNQKGSGGKISVVVDKDTTVERHYIHLKRAGYETNDTLTVTKDEIFQFENFERDKDKIIEAILKYVKKEYSSRLTLDLSIKAKSKMDALLEEAASWMRRDTQESLMTAFNEYDNKKPEAASRQDASDNINRQLTDLQSKFAAQASAAPTSTTTPNNNTNQLGYSLALRSSLPGDDINQAAPGKIYLSDDGKYVVHDPIKGIQEGSFDLKLIGDDLAGKIQSKDEQFVNAILKTVAIDAIAANIKDAKKTGVSTENRIGFFTKVTKYVERMESNEKLDKEILNNPPTASKTIKTK